MSGLPGLLHSVPSVRPGMHLHRRTGISCEYTDGTAIVLNDAPPATPRAYVKNARVFPDRCSGARSSLNTKMFAITASTRRPGCGHR